MTTPAIATSSSSTNDAAQATSIGSANVERVQRFMALWDSRPFDPHALAQFIAHNYIDHTRPQSEPHLSDRDVLLALSQALAAGFADGVHQLTVIEPVGTDRILVYWRFTGSHTGEFFGIPSTGRKVDFVGTDLLTLQDGRIVEHRHVEELHKAFAQLRVQSSPA